MNAGFMVLLCLAMSLVMHGLVLRYAHTGLMPMDREQASYVFLSLLLTIVAAIWTVALMVQGS